MQGVYAAGMHPEAVALLAAGGVNDAPAHDHAEQLGGVAHIALELAEAAVIPDQPLEALLTVLHAEEENLEEARRVPLDSSDGPAAVVHQRVLGQLDRGPRPRHHHLGRPADLLALAEAHAKGLLDRVLAEGEHEVLVGSDERVRVRWPAYDMQDGKELCLCGREVWAVAPHVSSSTRWK